MADYGIWLSWNNQKEGFQLPVNPESIEMSNGGNSTKYEVSSMGEINIIKSPQLTEYKFSSFFPAIGTRKQYIVDDKKIVHIIDPMVTAKFQLSPGMYIDMIRDWMASKRPIRFIFTGATFNINTAASIENFEWKEVSGSGGDIEYDLSLREYVFYAARRIFVSNVSGSSTQSVKKVTATRPNDKQLPKSYSLIAGDTLLKVAKKILGDDSRWKEIQKLNKISDASLKSLPVGMQLKIPL